MRDFRLKALAHFLARKQPTWGSPVLAELDYDDIRYFVRASETPSRSWDDVPEDVKRTFDRLGIPEAERKFLSGVGAQYESEVVYHQLHEDLEKQGVIFTDMDTALREHEDILRQYFATVIPPNDNKLAGLYEELCRHERKSRHVYDNEERTEQQCRVGAGSGAG